jgi:UDP-N-acetylglucosamine diphosphorylase/glucosamine-1-phosphate N-acetyltransferase
MRWALFEDSAVEGLAPLVLARPAFELRCGRMTLRERLLRHTQSADWGALVRAYLVEAYQEDCPDCHLNDLEWLEAAETLFVNARWVPPTNWKPALDRSAVGRQGGSIVYLTVTPGEVNELRGRTVGDWLEALALRRHDVGATGTLLSRPWDLVTRNADQLREDFDDCLSGHESPGKNALGGIPAGSNGVPGHATHCPGHPGAELRTGNSEFRFGPDVAIVGPADRLWIHPTARIDPYVVLDTQEGPVTIEADVRVLSFTRLEGPCHVGQGSELFRAHVRAGTTIGPVCRVGGEIEASILHGYVNKYHDGFLGHSYLCPWVNLGAETTTSDLKSDYSPVAVPLEGEPIDTGLTKVGSFIGDHTKTALGCLFNTGSSIGVWCTILPAGPLLPKFIPSFTSIWHGRLTHGLDFDRLAEAARTAMSRRGREFTPAQRRLYRTLFDLTAEERERAIHRHETSRAI